MTVLNAMIHGSFRTVHKMFGSPEMRAVFTRVAHLEKRGKIGKARQVLRDTTLMAMARKPPGTIFVFDGKVTKNNAAEALIRAHEQNPWISDAYSLIMHLNRRNMSHEAAALSAHCFHCPTEWFWRSAKNPAVSETGEVHPNFLQSIIEPLRPYVLSLVKNLALPIAGGRPIELRYFDFDQSINLAFSVNGSDVVSRAAAKGVSAADPAHPTESEVQAAVKALMGFTPTPGKVGQVMRQPILRIGLRAGPAADLVELMPMAKANHFENLFVIGICFGYRIPTKLSEYGRLPGANRKQITIFDYSILHYFKELARSHHEQEVAIAVM